jgi:hypothetical protein
MKSKKLRLILGLFVAVGLAACDSSDLEDEELSSVETASLYQEVSSELDLTSDQQNRFRNALAQHDRPDREPGFLWIVADSLADTLTDEQKQELFERTVNMERPFPFRGLLGHPGAGGFYGAGGLLGARRHHGESTLEDELNLTEEQQAELRSIHESLRESMRALKDQLDAGAITEDQFLAEILDLHEQKREAVDAVLTDDQKAALESFRQDRESAFEQFRASVHEVRDEVLGLSATQSEGFDSILQDQMEARELLVEDLKSGSITVAEFQTEVEALIEATDAALRALLSDAQYEVVQIHRALAMRVGRRGHKGMRHQRG